MSRYRGSVCRFCRREGMKLFLKGERCFSEKCSIDRRPEQTPGDHGLRRPKFSEYGIRLREKQKVKRMYGLTEKQFNRYFEKASRKKGVTGSLLISYLERRLDNVVYKLGFASSRKEARIMVRHGHFLVNSHKVDIPSYQIKADDTIAVSEKSSKVGRILQSLEGLARRGFPEWLEIDQEKLIGTVKRLPEREDVTIPIEEQLIVEFYSRV
ncbi:MAG: 30S ribosomal protein S4 [Candidatus Dadabacteria bacterium]|nr:30S ribosomal protein S4 [Candidatus Dadabacteria bacterium]